MKANAVPGGREPFWNRSPVFLAIDNVGGYTFCEAPGMVPDELSTRIRRANTATRGSTGTTATS
jgi:hypothetical protein